MNNALKKWVKECLHDGSKLIASRLRTKWLVKHYSDKYDEIINYTIFLDFNSTVSEKIYCIVNDIDYNVKCKNCKKNNCKFINFTRGYHVYCSVKCMCNNKEIRDKKKQTCLRKYGVEHAAQSQEIKDKTKQGFLEKFGVENPSQSKEIRDKTKQTCLKKYGVENVSQLDVVKEKKIKTSLKKYGVEHPAQSQEIKDKTKQGFLEKFGVENPSQLDIVKKKKIQTCLVNHGVEHPFQSKEIQEKIKQTCLEKYGVENPSQSDIIKEKKIQTCLANYGVEYPTQSQEIKDKKIKTCLEKYGVSFPSQLEETKEKQIQTCLKRYGVKHPNQSHISKKSLEKLDNKEWLKTEHYYSQKTLAEIAIQLNVCHKTIWNYFARHDIEVKNFSFSRYEKEILNFININNVKANIRSIISPYELDVYLPDYKLAIEFNGLYWHSSHNKDYHLMKTKMCEERGIQLLHIFENEWIDPIKQDVWKSIISNKLGRNDRVYGRKTEVREVIDNSLVKEFLNNNHLQGYCPSSVKIGLFFEDELISLMTFGKTRFSKKYEYEMIRFCNKKFISVVGGASKLYKYFITNYMPISVVSYCDRRYSDGDLYRKLGFTFSHCSAPNYFYFKLPSMRLFSRVKFQKHKLGNLLESFDSNKSEVENMLSNGYLRIFDCGNMVYTYEL